MAALPSPASVATRSVTRDWIESHYIYVIEEALFGEAKPSRLNAAINALGALAKFKGMIVEKRATLAMAVDKMDRQAVKAAAAEMLEQLEPGARAEVRRLLAQSDAIDVSETEAKPVTPRRK